MAGLIRKSLYTVAATALAGVAAAAIMVGYTETQCRAEPLIQMPPFFIIDNDALRPEARTYLTYPEWHIVYAYEDMARTLSRADAHEFDYLPAITGFWSSLCAVRAEADRVGDPGMNAKLTAYTIGASFTFEMIMKGVYEETLGRAASLTSDKATAQEVAAARMARNYSQFLHQTPWYEFDFDHWTKTLWAQPVGSGLSAIRSWERRIALGIEWKLKAQYAKLMNYAVGTVGPDRASMKIHVSGIDADQLSGLPTARIIAKFGDGLIVDVDRYGVFTEFVKWASRVGARINEIAGNDDILVSVISATRDPIVGMGDIIREIPRSGGDYNRYLVNIRVDRLTDFVRHIHSMGAKLEHVYDY